MSDKLRKLSSEWREKAGIRSDMVSMTYAKCADELSEALLSDSQGEANELRELRNQMALLYGGHLNPDEQLAYQTGAKSAADILDRFIRKRYPNE